MRASVKKAAPRKQRQASLPPRSLLRVFPGLRRVVDATEAIEVHVTAQDCEHATPLDPTACAMAKAAARERGADAAVIGISTSYIITGAVATRFKTPESIRREIVSFDRHHDFANGVYALTPPSPTGRLQGRPGGHTPRASHAPKRVVHHTANIRKAIDNAQT